MIIVNIPTYKTNDYANMEMIAWLVRTFGLGGWYLEDLNTNKKISWAWEHVDDTNKIAFKTEQDATLFKLRWL